MPGSAFSFDGHIGISVIVIQTFSTSESRGLVKISFVQVFEFLALIIAMVEVGRMIVVRMIEIITLFDARNRSLFFRISRFIRRYIRKLFAFFRQIHFSCVSFSVNS